MVSDDTAPNSGNEWSISALALAALTIGLFAMLANLLNHHHYPLFRAEVGLVALALLALAMGAAALHRLARPRLSFVLTGLYAAVLIDLGTDLPNMVFPVLAGVLALAAWRWEAMVLKLNAAAFASVLLFQVVDLVRAPGHPSAPRNETKHLQDGTNRNRALRPIVHLMLNSYIGFDGMSTQDTNFGDLRQQQERFYLDRGFQIYPGAYSRHAKTINSLPEFLSYGTAPQATDPRNVQSFAPDPLAYFNDLDAAGYRTSVWAPSFVDLCPKQPLSWCENYNRSDLAMIADSGLSAPERAWVIAANLLELSHFTSKLAGTIDLVVHGGGQGKRRHFYNVAKLYSLTGMARIDAVTRDLAGLKPGEARFVHLLLPHDPYVLDGDCKLLPLSGWGDEHGPMPLAQRDGAYARQLRCVTEHQIAALLKALDATEAGRQAIVIIQGDHGSRTFEGEPSVMSGLTSPRTAAIGYSVFFAVRVPGEPAATIDGRYALDELLGNFATGHFGKAPHPPNRAAEVWLLDADWIPVKRVPLPPFVQKFPKN